MAAPASPTELLDFIRKSGVVPPETLDRLISSQPKLPGDAVGVANLLVNKKLLTAFQAKLLLVGRYRGFRLGSYILLDQLGQGGMGAVYLATHEKLRRKAAIKVLPPGGNKIAVERFLREARAAAALDHPNIVRTHDVGRDGEVHYLVMEYVEGLTLDRLIANGGPLSTQRAVEYIAQAATGLQHAYEKGFIHRDIKPSNLILSKDGTVKILDMGLARSFEKSDQLTELLDRDAVVGTADYISPEQAMNDPGVDIRTDIYSLGATFFSILAGRPPFDGPTASKLIQHQMKDAPSLTKMDKTIPRELAKVVTKMMAKKPGDRFQTPADLIVALHPWLADTPSLMAGLSRTQAASSGKLSSQHLEFPRDGQTRRKKPLWIWAAAGGIAAFALVSACAAAAYILTYDKPKENPNAITKGDPAKPFAFPENLLTPAEVLKKKEGEEVAVQFTVQGGRVVGKRILLNSESDFKTDQNFTVVVNEKAWTGKFDKATFETFKGKTVRAHGKLNSFQTKLQLQIDDEKDLEIVGDGRVESTRLTVYEFRASQLPAFRALVEKQTAAEGSVPELPLGTGIQSYKDGSRGEFARREHAGKPALVYSNSNQNGDLNSAQLHIDLESIAKIPLKPNQKYVVSVEYATLGNGNGAFCLQSLDYVNQGNLALMPTSGEWKTLEFPFVRDPKIPLRFTCDSYGNDPANALLLSQITLREIGGAVETPNVGLSLSKLVLDNAKPISVSYRVLDDEINPSIKKHTLIGSTGEGKLPAGWLVWPWNPDTLGEASIGEFRGSTVLRVRNVEGPPTTMLFTPKFASDTGYCRIQCDVFYNGKKYGASIRICPDNGKATDAVKLEAKDSWQTIDAVVDCKSTGRARFEFHNSGKPEDFLLIRSYEVTSAAAR